MQLGYLVITVLVEIGDSDGFDPAVRCIGSFVKASASDAANFCDGRDINKLLENFFADEASCSCENDLHDE
jgi:hypothetical protein